MQYRLYITLYNPSYISFVVLGSSQSSVCLQGKSFPRPVAQVLVRVHNQTRLVRAVAGEVSRTKKESRHSAAEAGLDEQPSVILPPHHIENIRRANKRGDE